MTVHIHREELHADWADSMADWGAANAAELKHFTGLPACSGDCNQGRRACDCQPKEAASACTEIGAEPVNTPLTIQERLLFWSVVNTAGVVFFGVVCYAIAVRFGYVS